MTEENVDWLPTEEDFDLMHDRVHKTILQDKKQVLKAFKALEKYHESQTTSKSKDLAQILDPEKSKMLFADISLERIPQRFSDTLKGRRIPIAFPFRSIQEQDLDVCVITTEDDEERLASLVKNNPKELGFIKRILTRQKILKIYPSPQKKKELSFLHDVFVCDSRVCEAMPKTLGKYFVNGAKKILSCNMISNDYVHIAPHLPREPETRPKITEDASDLRQRLAKEIESTVLFYPRGSIASIRFAKVGMKHQEMLDNLAKVLGGVSAWTKEVGDDVNNILKSVRLKLGSISLPIFTRVPDLETLDVDDQVDENEEDQKMMLKRKQSFVSGEPRAPIAKQQKVAA